MPTRRRLKCAVVTAVAPAVVTATVLVAPAAGARAASAQAAPTAPAATVLSVASGPVGTPVTVTGTGFPAKKAAVVAVGSTTKRITTTATGRFTTAITIPRTSLSTIRITATAGTRSAGAPFTVTTAKSNGSARLGASAPAPTTTPAPAPTGAPTSTAAPAPATSSPAPAASAAPAISSARLRLGLSTPGGPTANGELDAASTTLGESPSIVMSHVDFTHPAPIAGLRSVAARGADSLITWEPWQGGAGVDQPAYANARIVAGDYDSYIRSWGADLAKYGQPVYLRFGHEMNGNWYPWSDGVNGNASGSYVQAWKHVHDLVAAQGATNVKWVWSPNVPYPGSTDLASLYPGADQVDVVALDGYNWGAVPGQRWTAPADLFGPGMAQLRAVAPGKPLIIGEVASGETGGSKADWDRDLVAYLQSQPDVLGFVWFDFKKEEDWRIDSSAASATALRDALALRRG
ncbi:glycoside hydrolase family 26 protein [Clavibacter nebraskensis]|uniref:Endoglucanase, glycosyl hydrolase family 26 n=2 Tax=Clavibacter nebraskensis TaxID=31963 RepID=A0AAI8ZKE7_9MICO|nr:glycosyl hydrolase [Clavibacter nebraskensis]CCE76583.1 endoglucanase, glycosyl hydrolase family 26 [Clavibacter nebraskensis NCPPB 2581]KXU19783.1 endoglucanase [Clavibacter nebraskensis]OAH17838.1 endoglucanase [Clavibacter nebraskensis]QGV70505.1 endoglucanase [Clavibacter nebraskensis]QGV73296.1 endoglucanase [Clavibacter nebraskensis]